VTLQAAAPPLAAIALALGALGCGGDDDTGFRDDYLAESGEIGAIGIDIGRTLNAAGRQSNAGLARQLTDLARRAQGSVRDLEALDPPEDLTDEHHALVGALERGTGDLRAIASAARSGDRGKARAATRKLAMDSVGIRTARRRLNRLVRRQ
jgi:hypothetical protein